jgi:hypothetical protein
MIEVKKGNSSGSPKAQSQPGFVGKAIVKTSVSYSIEHLRE